MPLARSRLFATQAAAGAEFGEVDGWATPAHYRTVEEETAAVRRAAGLYDLPWAAPLTLVGPDARRFANGMFTNNIRDLPPGRANRSALTDEKGRMLGLLDTWCEAPEAFVLVLDGISAAAFTERYAKFMFFDDVEMTDLAETHGVVSLQGPDAAEVLARSGLPAPEGVASAAEIRVARKDRSGCAGFDILAPAEALVPLWEGLRGAGATPVGWDAQEALRVAAGRVRWPVDMGERALVHEMGLVAECCSFEKGCYVGQEVINRIDVMGQVNKRIWGLAMDEDAIPPLEAEVKLADGNVVGVARSGAREGGRARVLALLRKPAWNPGLRVEVHASGRVVGAVVSALPFPA
jgi:folate-binding protein YgfZ